MTAALHGSTLPAHWRVRSALPGLAWPGIPDPASASLLALMLQLEQSQWLPTEQLVAAQMRQVDALLAHAAAGVPLYRDTWGRDYDPSQPMTPERFAQLPVLTRPALQQHFDALQARAPQSHGPVNTLSSSGSTGTPVRVQKAALTSLYWAALNLRDHAWRNRDLEAKLVAIRHGVPTGDSPSWGRATAALFETGPSAVLGIGDPLDVQLRWLQRQQPQYLLSYPSVLAALAQFCIESGATLPGLREVRSIGEQLGPDVRTLCRDAWGVPLTDVYTAEETGIMALQCPAHEHYHVAAEDMLVEVVDEAGRACAPGDVGRVLVTPLHNFAMPLLRYELGDWAEAGVPCPCGRGLPVLKRILGRTRNLLVTADGRRYWPGFGSRSLTGIAPVRQHQFVQKTHHLIEARLVTARPLTPDEESAIRASVLSRLPPGFELVFAYPAAISRSASGKFEDFICEVAAPGR